MPHVKYKNFQYRYGKRYRIVYTSKKLRMFSSHFLVVEGPNFHFPHNCESWVPFYSKSILVGKIIRKIIKLKKNLSRIFLLE